VRFRASLHSHPFGYSVSAKLSNKNLKPQELAKGRKVLVE
jgi:hypothetical protein